MPFARRFARKRSLFPVIAALAVAVMVAAAPQAINGGLGSATVRAQPTCGGTATGESEVVTTTGAVRGAPDGRTLAFKGIPYAAPPVGALRWQPPRPHDCWDGVREATAFGPMCPQLTDQGDVVGDEDCLTLNVWTPGAGGDRPLPVMVFIHGGGNAQGASSLSIYDGRRLAEQGVVLVSINYRLGPLGFLSLPQLAAEQPDGSPGNNGILDQIAALRWVQANIAAFNGDPNRVMIFGESAGAVDVCVLLASPLAGGLFQRAAMESGACLGPVVMAASARTATRFLAASPCADAADAPSCLRALPIDQVLRILPATVSVTSAGTNPYGPVVDGSVLPAAPAELIRDGRFNQVPFLIGSNADETGQATGRVDSADAYRALVVGGFGQALGQRVLAEYPVTSFTTPRAAAVAVSTDARFVCPARSAARGVAAHQSGPVYRYFFTQTLRGPGAALGSFHGLELVFVFGTLGQGGDFSPDQAEQALIAAMQGYWTRFAATGDPNGGGTPAWPVYDPATDPYLELGPRITAGAGVRTGHCDFWDSLTG